MDRLLEATARAERDHFWFRGFRRFVRPLLRRAAAGGGRIDALDCGAGTGANLRLLAEVARPFGVELAWTGLQHARSAGLTRIARATVASLPFEANRFSLVTSFDVLYCLEPDDERAAVGEMFRVLRPGGFLVVNVAASPVLRGNHSVLSRELRRYTRSSLRRLLAAAGFDVLRLTYTNASLFPVMLGVRLAQRAAGFQPEERADAEISIPAAPVNLTLSGLLALEALALRAIDMPFGSSLLALARKPLLVSSVRSP
jgi:SAM-dependent methyltransferase